MRCCFSWLNQVFNIAFHHNQFVHNIFKVFFQFQHFPKLFSIYIFAKYKKLLCIYIPYILTLLSSLLTILDFKCVVSLASFFCILSPCLNWYQAQNLDQSEELLHFSETSSLCMQQLQKKNYQLVKIILVLRNMTNTV